MGVKMEKEYDTDEFDQMLIDAVECFEPEKKEKDDMWIEYEKHFLKPGERLNRKKNDFKNDISKGHLDENELERLLVDYD